MNAKGQNKSGERAKSGLIFAKKAFDRPEAATLLAAGIVFLLFSPFSRSRSPRQTALKNNLTCRSGRMDLLLPLSRAGRCTEEPGAEGREGQGEEGEGSTSSLSSSLMLLVFSFFPEFVGSKLVRMRRRCLCCF